ncbi:MAG: hypothetical protein ACO1PB_07110 [Ramlibacter sp.]
MVVTWEEKLRQAFGANHVRLTTGIAVIGVGDSVVMEMTHAGVTGNMQSDAAAFEAWALVLHRWCGARRVALRWPALQVEELQDEARRWPTEQLHYQRFLYRLLKFHELFGADWFEADVTTARAQSRCREGAMFLNAPGARTETNGPKDKPEARLEWDLLYGDRRDALKAYCGSPSRWLPDRQIPVGLFTQGVPKARHAVFPGGAGAIDLAALGDDRLWLFELKAEGNLPVGTLSELLFYTAVVRDLCTKAIRPANVAAVEPDRLTAPAMAEARRVTGVMLAPRLHPLLDEKVLELLNGAIDRRWNAVRGAPAVDVEAATILGSQLTRRAAPA